MLEFVRQVAEGLVKLFPLHSPVVVDVQIAENALDLN
jgi:hypothetical protein